ncbi:YbfB/YjiJ family MFS transporter, partial [Intrasporangium sp.]|uniref:YbfB/YjiJ family MFS transporter n=1 Tax=Intrasporangium sp. TaxID=1925024 RepID=UPI002939B65E
LPQPLWTAGLAFATIAFGLGQTVGPSLTGWVSDRTADLGTGLLLSAALLVVGAGLALVQREGPGRPSARVASDRRTS